KMMFLSLTFDHRIIDGAPAAEFLRDMREAVEDPETTLGKIG
ncbi:MAG: 2-oxo acid dehydrogenase subunit E2, partial [Deltaproteobacteria bacterium]|nr:2-oxo acid dehydrogenase subunit E2 [Deltaproteobacteria bacterium]